MRTLILLAAILLAALHAQAELFSVNVDEVLDQQQPGSDQDLVIHFTGEESSALQVPDIKGICACRRYHCPNFERFSGYCRVNGVRYRRCCSRR
ncbi:corticostatin 1 [Lepus europaeus]|uniref:corticostatin 1 n=1 Tax=Lepus europaeus TaxID=9983 RepID=UPI002B47C785|nr:corticostatin 1 [Lepus europaeus]